MKIKDLKVVGFKSVVLPDTTIPAFKAKYISAGVKEQTAPKEIVLVGNYKYYDDVYEVLYLNDKGQQTKLLLPPDYEVEESKLSKETMAKLCATEQGANYILGSRPMIGADPEIFVVDKKDELIPAFTFLPKKPGKEANRTDPHNMPVYWDGFQAEFETKPDTCFGWHTDRIQYGLKNLLNMARAKDKGAKLSIKTVMDIPKELLDSAQDEHVEFGCMPSLNVYGLEGNKRSGREVDYRPVGGHIHFGVGKLPEDQLTRAIKTLDAICAVACVSMFANFDDPRRRRLYGLPGEHRLPPHGVEYRTLSNAWLAHPVITHLVFDLARNCLNLGIQDLFQYLNWTASEERTVNTILNTDVEEARKIMQENKDAYILLFKASYKRNVSNEGFEYSSQAKAEAAFGAFFYGMESIVKDPSDIENNWNLTSSWITHCGNPGKMFTTAYPIILKGKKVA